MQQMDTHGLNRSPIRAAFQKSPRNPVRYGSISFGAICLTYVQVQMESRTMVRKDLKSNNADMVCPRVALLNKAVARGCV
eukprot:699099-Pyramimonas_sp.AAC.1